MSNINFMKKLLDDVEVEWKPISKVLVRTKGTKITAGQMKELHKHGAPVKIFAGGKTVAFVNYGDIPAKDINRQPSIIVKSRGVIEFEYYDQPFSHKNEMWSYFSNKAEISIKYIYHFLKLNEPYFKSIGAKMQMPQISTPDTDKFLVPIPCPDNPEKSLAIQAEIVRILDSFTELTFELTAELTAEVKARKEHYSYFRAKLFSNSSHTTEKLGDIADIYLGLTYTPHYVEKGVRFISAKNTSKDFLDLSDTKYISEDEYLNSTSNAKPKRGDLLFTRVGSNLGHPVIVDTDEPLCMFVSLGFIRVNPKKVLSSYIKHWMNTDLFWEQVKKHTYGAAKVNLNTGWLKKFDVLLPSLEDQTRIATILDKFDALTNSIAECLPREIELRQKQYEFYRDLLLSFPKPEVAA